MDSTKSFIKPNDVALIFRPYLDDEGGWTGQFNVLVSAFGPPTVSEEHISDMMSLAIMLSAAISLIEKDAELAGRLMDKSMEMYAEDQERYDVSALTANTKTYGGLH